ncbi:MAG: hypothetical protein O3A58_01430 [Proteobacteria bacterium]|nr:hypothetical protein [Pseudomonadota bacterium]
MNNLLVRDSKRAISPHFDLLHDEFCEETHTHFSTPQEPDIQNDSISLIEDVSDIPFSLFIANRMHRLEGYRSNSLSSKGVRILLCGGSICCGFISWYPIIQGIMKIGSMSKTIKVILAGGSWISYGALYAWGTLKVSQKIFTQRENNEAVLYRNETHCAISLSYKVSILVLGLFACIPNAYFSYKFNNNSLAWAAINIAGSWGLSTYSIHNMFSETTVPRFECFRQCASNSFMEFPFWNQIRDHLVEVLESEKETTAISNSPVILNSVENDPVTDRVANLETLSFFSRAFHNYEVNADRFANRKSFFNQKIVRYPIFSLSMILPISNIVANGTAAYIFSTIITHSIILRIVIVCLALSPSYLEFSLNRDCMYAGIRRIYEWFTKTETKTISSVYYYALSRLVTAIASFISLLSISIDYTTAREIYDKDTVADNLAVSASVINSLALTLLPMIYLSQSLLMTILYPFCSSQIKRKLDYNAACEDIIQGIKESNQQEFKRLFDFLMTSPGISQKFIEAFPILNQHEREAIL